MLNQIKVQLEQGKAKIVKELVANALESGIAPDQILNAMLEAMGVVGVKFKNNEVFVPEVLIAARALNMGLEVLKPALTASGVEPVGKAVIGTIEGDLHDIGKNLVKMLMVGAGIEVIDLGVNVTAEKFVDEAVKNDVQVICISALLTTTMINMEKVIKLLEERNLRDRFKVFIGGAPVTENFKETIGADYFTKDAQSCAEVCKSVLLGK